MSSLTETELRTDGIAFVFVAPHHRYHQSVCLAQGLERLGVPFFANADHHPRPDGPPLFSRADRHPGEAAVTLVDLTGMPTALLCEQATQDKLARVPGRRRLYLHLGDDSHKFYLPDHMPLVVTAESHHLRLPGRRLPWAYGLTDEVAATAEAERRPWPRQQSVLRNFRPSLAQSVRQLLDLALVPLLERHFIVDRDIDGEGHAIPGHFRRLGRYAACAAWGGMLEEDLTANPYLRSLPEFMRPAGAAVFPDRFQFLRQPAVMRWDSWRLWEAWAAGCLVLHLDFARYGFALPAMPENWVHYIGFDLADLPGGVARMLDERDRWPAIAEAGRTWMLEHYAPLPVARRLVAALFELF